MASVGFKAVFKSYGDQEIIHGVDCEIDDGEFIVVVGPSGCGKSTLLRMVAGLESVTAGEIFIGGRSVNKLEPAQRDIAMVFQNYALYPHMSVFDNMAYGLKIRRLSKADIADRVKKVADILELTPDILTRKPSQLSGGQRQRVAMGRAIVREPSVFLFDEPLSNLDAKLRVQMRLEIKKLQQDLGVTSIYVTHDQIEAMTLGHRLMVLNAGNVEQLGTPIELYERPATTFVAGFIGSPSMNFLSARIGSGGNTVEISSGTTLSLDNNRLASEAGRTVNLGIRPEHIHLVDESAAAMHMVTELVEHLGADTLAHGHIGNDRTALTIRLQGVCDIKAGDRLPLAVEPSTQHLFDVATGARIDA